MKVEKNILKNLISVLKDFQKIFSLLYVCPTTPALSFTNCYDDRNNSIKSF